MTKKREVYTTEAGVFKYPHLSTPDHGTKEYPKDKPEYNVRLILSPEESAKLKAFLMPFYEDALEEGKAKFDERPVAARKKNPFDPQEPGTPIYDDDENETGEMEFKFKTKAFYKDRVTGEERENKLAVFDAKGNRIPKDVEIWGGTVGKVSYNIAPYFVDANHMCGLTLYLNSVQVLELVSEGTRTAASFGFEVEEGFTYEAEEEDTAEDEDITEDTDIEEDADF